MKLYEGKIWIPDHENPRSYTVILSEDKSKVEEETNKVKDLLNRIPSMDVINWSLLEELIPEELGLKDLVREAAESRSHQFSINLEIKEHEIDVNLLNNLMGYSEELIKLSDRVSKLTKKEAESELYNSRRE